MLANLRVYTHKDNFLKGTINFVVYLLDHDLAFVYKGAFQTPIWRQSLTNNVVVSSSDLEAYFIGHKTVQFPQVMNVKAEIYTDFAGSEGLEPEIRPLIIDKSEIF
jgi:hypothetical protein